MPSAQPSATRPQNVSLMDVIVGVELFILALVYSRTYTFYPALRSPLNWAAFLIPLAFVVPAFIFRVQAALITIGIVVVLFVYQLWFASIWNTPFTGTALGSYQALLLTAMIAMHARKADPERFLAIFFTAAVCYLILYLYLYLSIDPESIRSSQMQGRDDFAAAIRRTHSSRGGYNSESDYKVGTSGAIMAFLVVYSFAWVLTERRTWKKTAVAAIFAIAVYATWISDSRWNTLSIVLACVMLLVPMGAQKRSYFAIFIVVVGTLLYTTSAFVSFNMFSVAAKDVTGGARFEEFNVANPVFLRTPVVGIGLKNSSDDYDAVFQGDVFTSDLGWYGDLVQTGLVGLLLVLLMYWLIAQFITKLLALQGASLSVNFASAYLVYLSVVGYITPQLSAGAGGIILCWALAYTRIPNARFARESI